MKICRGCHVEKILSDFYRNTPMADGHLNYCKKCSDNKKVDYNNTPERKKANALALKKWRKENPELRRAQDKRHYYNDPAKRIRKAAIWAEKNKERKQQNQAEWYARTFDIMRDTYCKNSRRWTKENRPHANAIRAKYKASKKNATPRWANDFFMREAYALSTLRSKVSGFEWHVDHIVPLQSKVVCGLHVEHNLQVIPASINCRKNNRHWPNMP